MKLNKTREALDQAGFGGALHLRREALAEIEQWEALGVAALDVSDAETKGIHALSREIHILDRKLVPIVKGELFVEPEVDTLEEDGDSDIEESVSNIRMALQRLYPAWEATGSEGINEAIVDLEQAVRYLTAEETPS